MALEQGIPVTARAIMASVSEETGIAEEDAWPQYEEMARWLEEDKEEQSEPNINLVAPDVRQHFLLEARESAVRKEKAILEQKKPSRKRRRL